MKTKKLPKGLMEARMMPETFNEKTRTVDVIWTTGMAVKRFDWWEGRHYFEELSMEPEHVRMERMDRGAPVLNTHDQFRLESVIGVVEKASLKGDEGHATVRLSEREDIAGIVKDIQDGILRNISVGYKIHKAEESRNEETNMSTFRVVDWEPLEISFVPVPADFNAQVRSEEEVKERNLQSFDCEVITIPNKKGEGMLTDEEKALLEKKRNEEASNEVETPAEEPSEVPAEEPQETPVEEPAATEEEPSNEEPAEEAPVAVEPEPDAEKSAVKLERTRTNEILELCKKHEVSQEDQKRFINDGVSAKDAGTEILKMIEKRNEDKTTNNKLEITGMENKTLRREAMVRGLLHVADPKRNKLKDGDNEYRATSILSAARMYVERELGEKNVLSMTPQQVAKRALHHSSDFPLILEDICNKSLMQGFTEVNTTYQQFVRAKSVSDFKEISSVRVGTGGLLNKVNEHGEYKRSTIQETGEKYRIEKFGEIIGATEELLINDDLGAFAILPLELGAKVARTENEAFWELVYTPQVMADGNPLFDASHANLGTGGVISDATLSEARTKMRLQKDIADKRLNLRPSVLVVPAALENTALKFLTTVVPNSVTGVNNFANSMELLVEPILDDADAAAWYTFGSLAQGPMAEKATLDGMGPQISVRENWDIDGMETKIKYFFGMRIVDHRQFFKNAGA